MESEKYILISLLVSSVGTYQHPNIHRSVYSGWHENKVRIPNIKDRFSKLFSRGWLMKALYSNLFSTAITAILTPSTLLLRWLCIMNDNTQEHNQLGPFKKL